MKRSEFKFNHLPFIIFILLVIFTNEFAFAKLEIPYKLTKVNRAQVLEILGLSSSYKNVADPYPLGGYSGVQLNYTVEYFPISELSQLGSKTGAQSDFSYSTVTIGKGLFQNIDLFIQMTPFEQQEDFNKFGGQLRWGFYDAKNSPLLLSLSLFANSTNFQNLISITSQGYDLIADYQIDNTSVYLGWGMIRVFGVFTGGSVGLTDSNNTEQDDLSDIHSFLGFSIKLDKTFFALQMDRYKNSTYSASLGFRF
jgi:hypothetical protein